MREKHLIILANSRKKGNRCIAGIDTATGEWIRPVYEDGDQGVPWNVRQVDGKEPRLLDILSIPLASDGPHRDIQPENRSILKGAWKKVGQATPQQVAQYCQSAGLVLHNADRRIHIATLRQIREANRKSCACSGRTWPSLPRGRTAARRGSTRSSLTAATTTAFRSRIMSTRGGFPHIATTRRTAC
jgi:hypothetical protein